MIEKIVLDYLNDALEVPVFMEMPGEKNRPDKYVLIEKTGSSMNNYISTATIAIQSYADTLYSAALLNEDVKTAMDDIIILDSVSKAKLNTDYNFTDTTKKQYRYQAVYDLVY